MCKYDYLAIILKPVHQFKRKNLTQRAEEISKIQISAKFIKTGRGRAN